MKTVKDAYQVFNTGLMPLYNAGEAEAIASLVLTEVTGLSRAALKAFTDTELNVVQSERLLTLLDELKTGRPVQYILGHTEFYGMPFEVNSSVLIPRPETEELVEWILKTLPANGQYSILDIGTGSGCIPIVLKSKLINSKLFAIDISSSALATAGHNAAKNIVEITFVEADILHLEAPQITSERYHAIVSNPPYVTETDKQQMHRNVTDFEPHTALFVPDHEPLLFYKAIARFASTNLVNGGYLFLEINESYGVDTVQMLTMQGFNEIELRQDMSGKDRMIRAFWT